MSRAERMGGGPAALFAYGTLRFDEVLAALLDRVPTRSTVAAAGWRAAALAGRVYPGLVRADAEVTGTLITGLTPAELRLIDEYEAGPYQLELLTLSDGRQGWTYAWTDQAEVLSHDWSPGEFAELHLADFAGRCRAWRDGYEAAGRTSGGIRRPHDPGPGSADPTRPKPGPLWMVISGVEHAACPDGARPQRKAGRPLRPARPEDKAVARCGCGGLTANLDSAGPGTARISRRTRCTRFSARLWPPS